MACLESLSALSPSHPSSSAKNGIIPFEFIELIEKTKKIFSIKQFDPANAGIRREYVTTPSRHVQVGSDQQGKKIIFIKSRISSTFTAIQDQIAFMISKRLNLNVVPPTMAIEGYKDLIDQHILHDNKKYFLSNAGTYEGVVIQEGISLNSNQIQLSEMVHDNINGASRCLSILNTDQLCNAIFFNIITGRIDADRTNSVIDEFNQVVELDNEGIGGKKTESWMLKFFSEFVLPKKPIENLLAKDISIIDGVFNDVSHFPTNKSWRDKDQENITANFVQLKKILIENKEKDLKVSDLGLFEHRRSKDF